MDVLVPIPMKNAAKCDKQCELQNSANHQIFERKWRQRDILPACLFQCLRGFTIILMWLNSACLMIVISSTCSFLSWKMREGIFRSNEVVTSLECDFIGSTELSFLTRGIIIIIYLLYDVLLRTEFNKQLSRPCIWDRQDHPLNLSISLSGGKEINEDCLSSGERSGKSPSLKSEAFRLRIVI
jgi:hypothetical protein